MNQIACKAGVNKSLIYYYFNSKDRLYRLALSTTITGFLDSLEKKLFVQKQEPVTKSLFIRVFFDHIFEYPEFIKMLHWELVAGGNELIRFFEDLSKSRKIYKFYNSIVTVWQLTDHQNEFDNLNLEFVRFFGALLVYPLMHPFFEWVLGLDENNKEKFLDDYIQQMECF